MGELLEDPDGCPYPDEVQAFHAKYVDQSDLDARLALVAALESVARQAFKQGRRQ